MTLAECLSRRTPWAWPDAVRAPWMGRYAGARSNELGKAATSIVQTGFREVLAPGHVGERAMQLDAVFARAEVWTEEAEPEACCQPTRSENAAPAGSGKEGSRLLRRRGLDERAGRTWSLTVLSRTSASQPGTALAGTA